MNTQIYQHRGSASHFCRDIIKEEDYQIPLYATPAAHHVGAVTQSRWLEYRTASSMPVKRTNSGEPAGPPPAKQVKTEHPEEFSNQVKKKLQSSTRTGQACDRCKVRKIRCDGLPGGCSPCLQNNTACQTTDRITGRATQRGYVEGLEQHNRDLENRVRELERMLQGGSSDIRPPNGYQDVAPPSYDYNHSMVPAAPWTSGGASLTRHSSSSMTSGNQEANVFRALPAFRAGCIGDNYLGVATGNSSLSSIKGTALSILGMEINIADFSSVDMDEPDSADPHTPLYNKSYQAFLQSALNINPPIEKVELPRRVEGITYAEWYFRVVNPYMPLLHKPTFMKLLENYYDDPPFRPTVAELVMIHMVFAIMFFQYAARNLEDDNQQAHLTHQSNMHYHYSLSKFYQLACSHTFHDVQALTLICAHLRNFPKPGASWILTQTTMSLAVELGLHRSAKRWATEAPPNLLEVEMRKRTFWAILTICVTLSGKLGRPMPFRYEDFDVEFPEAYDDELLSEKGLDTSREGKCLHEIGLQATKLMVLYMEMYSTIYGIRRMSTERYFLTVERLESKLRAWQEGLPRSLVNGESGQNEQEGRVFAVYTECWALEFRLLLRHPSVSMTSDPAFNAESMRICVESSRKMLGVVRQLQKFKSLDTTWYNVAVYVMAITTTLFAQWEKREGTSAADLAALREEMDLWLEIMGDVGALLGSGNRLREAVRVVTDGTFGILSKRLPVKNGGYLQHNQNNGVSKSPVAPTTGYPPAPTLNYSSGSPQDGTTTSIPYHPSGPPPTHSQTPYPVTTQYSTYSEAPANLPYTPQDIPQAYSAYAGPSDAAPEGNLLAAFATQASQAQAQAAVGWRGTTPVNSGSGAWQQWTSTIAGSLEPQDCYSASALMQLGGRELPEGPANPQTTTVMATITASNQAGQIEQGVVPLTGQNGAQVSAGLGVTWPLNVFDIGQGSANS